MSEHLPAEVIDVPVSIAQRSLCLRKALVQQALTQASERQITLPYIDPMGFRLYVEWLRSGHIDCRATILKGSSNGIPLRDAFDLIFAHITGSQLEEPDFQDYVIDTAAHLLDASQTPDLKVLEVVFLERGASNILKQFVVDRMFAVERRMLGLMRGACGDQESQTQSLMGCRYHVHGLGKCYKTNARYERTNIALVSRKDLDWNRVIEHHDINSTSCILLTPQDSTAAGHAEVSSVTDTQYFDIVEWCRQGHSRECTMPTPNLQIDKPLPNIPPLTLGSSPPPPSSPCSPPPSYSDLLSLHQLYNSCNHLQVESSTTQQIVLECLSRLPHSALPPTHSLDAPSDLHRTAIPELVLECLERFNRISSRKASTLGTSCSERSSPNHCLEPTSPQLQNAILLSSSANVLSYYQAQLEPSSEVPPQPQLVFAEDDHLSSTVFVPASSPTSHAFSHVKRKPVPPRGIDWLRQYDCINSMMKDIPIVVAKMSKTSRFRETMKGEGRAELGA
jgi:hypothetical protein